jgi:hypothetical protein
MPPLQPPRLHGVLILRPPRSVGDRRSTGCAGVERRGVRPNPSSSDGRVLRESGADLPSSPDPAACLDRIPRADAQVQGGEPMRMRGMIG